jgi:hypothetical protein
MKSFKILKPKSSSALRFMSSAPKTFTFDVDVEKQFRIHVPKKFEGKFESKIKKTQFE